MFITEKEAPFVIHNIRDELDAYIVTNNLKSLVIGVSGGIDSTLCCALAEPVCKHLGIPLIGRSLPLETNTSEEITRARITGEAFCDSFWEVDLHNMLIKSDKVMNDVYGDIIREKIRRGNLKARLRMIYLYNLAFVNKGMVLSTDNYTEYLLGFWTLHGDVGDFGMIQNLWKTEVYTLSKYLLKEYSKGSGKNIKRAEAMDVCIKAIPTDGLGITSSDLEQLGAKTYEEVDNLLYEYTKDPFFFEPRDISIKSHPVIQRHLKSGFKRNNPYNISRERLLS